MGGEGEGHGVKMFETEKIPVLRALFYVSIRGGGGRRSSGISSKTVTAVVALTF